MRTRIDDVRGFTRIAIDAAIGGAGIVESMHRTIQRIPAPVGKPIEESTRGITGLVYRSVQGTMRLTGRALDFGLDQLARRLPDQPVGPQRDRLLARINGLWGDYLASSNNPLAIDMSLRHEAESSDRVLVLVHGLCMSDHDWLREGHDHGRRLADDLGYAPVYVRYNSGLPIAENGRALAAELATLVEAWPEPVSEIAFIGHSMGGLVIRAALHHAERDGADWTNRVSDLVFLGTPHGGAPLERIGRSIDQALQFSPYLAPFARPGMARSAGITDLRDARVSADGEPVLLPACIRCYAVAGRLKAEPAPLRDSTVGDGLVPVASALGLQGDRPLDLPEDRRWISNQTGHFDLLSRPEVYAQLRSWLDRR